MVGTTKPKSTPKYWLGVASGSHVEYCIRDGRCVFGHGQESLHQPMRKGDCVVFYAPRQDYKSGARLQEFVAVGELTSDKSQSAHGTHWRRARWRKRVQTAPIRSMLDRLDLTKDLGKRWGVSLRLPVRQITRRDFQRICKAMRVDLR